jgi:hypothetical protein
MLNVIYLRTQNEITTTSVNLAYTLTHYNPYVLFALFLFVTYTFIHVRWKGILYVILFFTFCNYARNVYYVKCTSHCQYTFPTYTTTLLTRNKQNKNSKCMHNILQATYTERF